MTLKLGDTAPNFTQESTEGPIDFYQYTKDKWCILFSHPKVHFLLGGMGVTTVARFVIKARMFNK